MNNPLVTKFLAVCPRRNSLLWPCWQVSYARPLSCPPAHPGPRIHESSAPSKSVSVLKEGNTLPHRPLVSPYVFRAIDTIFSSHVILVSLRMLYHTIPAGRTSSLRQKRQGMVSTRLWMQALRKRLEQWLLTLSKRRRIRCAFLKCTRRQKQSGEVRIGLSRVNRCWKISYQSIFDDSFPTLVWYFKYLLKSIPDSDSVHLRNSRLQLSTEIPHLLQKDDLRIYPFQLHCLPCDLQHNTSLRALINRHYSNDKNIHRN